MTESTENRSDIPFIDSLNPWYYVQPGPSIQIPSTIPAPETIHPPFNSNFPSSNKSPGSRAVQKPPHIIPEVSRKFGATAWRQVVKDWEEIDPSRSHDVALKDWDPEWHRSSGESAKYGQRQMIAIEFIE